MSVAEDAAATATATATVLAVISFLSSTVAGTLAYMANRDKIRNDKDMALKDARLKMLEEGRAEAETDRKEITERLVRVEREYDECRRDREKLHNSLHAQKVMISLLRSRIDGKLPDDIESDDDPPTLSFAAE